MAAKKKTVAVAEAPIGERYDELKRMLIERQREIMAEVKGKIREVRAEGADKDRYEIVDTDDELELPADMRSNYYMPSHIRSEANTGPKGVIADAQAFEQAKKQARRFTWKKNAAPQQQQQYNVTAYQGEPGSSDEENDGGFMKQWRESRLRELQNAGERFALGLDLGLELSPESPLHNAPLSGSLSEQVEAFERALIAAELTRNHNSLRSLAEALGVPRKTLHDKLRKHGLNFADAGGSSPDDIE